MDSGLSTHRHLLNSLCLLALMLGVPIALMRAFGGSLQLVRPLGIELNADRGTLYINHYRNWPQPPPPGWRRSGVRFYYDIDLTVPWVYAGEGSSRTSGGFSDSIAIRPQASSSTTATQQVEQREIAAPFWLLVPCLLALPFVTATRCSTRWRRSREARRNGGVPCPRCGYDLRGSSGGGVPGVWGGDACCPLSLREAVL